jgi:hypothetical protein
MLFVAEDILMIFASIHDVIEGERIFKSRWSGHGWFYVVGLFLSCDRFVKFFESKNVFNYFQLPNKGSDPLLIV